MAYTKTIWVSGVAPPISAPNLNNLETQYESIVADYMLAISVVKTSDETVTSNITLQNDDELLLPVVANKRYGWLAGIQRGGHATVANKITWVVPAGATGQWGAVGQGWSDKSEDYATSANSAISTTDSMNLMMGTIDTAATPGNLQFQFAQAVSNGTPVTIKAGSWLTLWLLD